MRNINLAFKIISVILFLFVTYYAWCTFTGRAIYTVFDDTKWEKNESTGSSSSSRYNTNRGFHHK